MSEILTRAEVAELREDFRNLPRAPRFIASHEAIRVQSQCPCCKDGCIKQDGLERTCTECRGTGLAIMAYEVMRAHWKLMRDERDALLQPPDVDCWKDLVRLSHADGGDAMLRINRITAEYNRIRSEFESFRHNASHASKLDCDAATRKAFEDAAEVAIRHYDECEFASEGCCEDIAAELRRRAGEVGK